MNIEGKWKGYYEYGVGYQLPFFGSRVEIEVDFKVDNDENITGTISETPSDFSVNAEATIKGFIDQSLISFIKSYPFYPMIDPENNKIEFEDGALDIQHTGFIDKENKAIYGEWLIEEKFINEEGQNDISYETGTWLVRRID